MTATPYQHTPVMAREVVELLAPADGKTIVDCTLGGGGHTYNLKLQTSNLKIIGFDQDTEAITAAKEKLKQFDGITYIHDNFSQLKKYLKEPVDGFLFDLGVSSYQINTPARGFSLQHDGPLDMRMDPGGAMTAADLANHYSLEELTQIIGEYGEERFAGRIARSIVKSRPLSTTGQLKELIEKAIPTWRKRESVTRVFQGLRIAVNDELNVLKSALSDSIALLKPGGRIVVIAYHSLEDRIAKHTFREAAQDGKLKVLTKRPLAATEAEREENPRARSAKLRAAEKL
ncbi:MAG: 16S rRNA (cytosine(1402)-N(4))-methyltransferase RsmH [Candidatus Margulisiibacteriota bacterium]